MQEVLNALATYSATQWIALITGLAYVVLAARQQSLCWAFGIISCTLIAYEDFAVYRLYADGVLQIFYVIMGFLGLYFWIFRNAPGKTLPVTQWPIDRHLIAIAVSVVLSIPLAWLLRHYTDAAYSYPDTLTTILSLWATWLLVRKVLENWLYWIAIDAVLIILYYQRGGTLVAVLYAVYCAVAVYGYLQWKRDRAESIEGTGRASANSE